jgi:sugar (pentulose or hexulose) kinase
MYIGFDLGTTGEKALLIDEDQRVITSAVDRPRIWKVGH